MNSSRSVIKANQVQVQPAGLGYSRPAAAPASPQPAPAPAPAGLDLSSAQQSLLTAAVAQSQEILEKARAQAAEMLQAARDHAAEVTRQARAAGREAAEAEAGHLLLSAKGVLDEVQVWREQVAAGSERMVLDLVIDIARALFGDGWSLDGPALKAAFAHALAEARPLGDLRVHVHPDDAAVLGPHWPEQQSTQLGQHLELVPDPAIRRGGCLVEGDYGAVDARVETQLQLAIEALAEPAQAPRSE
jgi:flagellar assembly protein FliH